MQQHRDGRSQDDRFGNMRRRRHVLKFHHITDLRETETDFWTYGADVLITFVTSVLRRMKGQAEPIQEGGAASFLHSHIQKWNCGLISAYYLQIESVVFVRLEAGHSRDAVDPVDGNARFVLHFSDFVRVRQCRNFLVHRRRSGQGRSWVLDPRRRRQRK